MTHDQAFLHDIREHPEDDAPRLIYADWLMEQGNPRGEFIRVQCELARLPKKDRKRAALEARERELLQEHEAAWRSELPGVPGLQWGPFERGFSVGLRLPAGRTVRFRSGDPAEFWRCVLQTSRAHPYAIRSLMEDLLQSETDSHTWQDAILSFLPEHDWPALAARAVKLMIRDRGNRLAESILQEPCTQCPWALHPHLDDIFKHRFLARTYYSTSPWRDSGQQHTRFLVRTIDHATTREEDRVRAWRALLETRTEENLELALERAEPMLASLRGGPANFEKWLSGNLHEAGLDHEDGRVRSLYGERAWHLAFPDGYFPEGDRHPSLERFHPTWDALDNLTEPMQFGGASAGRCAFCDGQLHRILALDPAPAGVGVASVPSLSLEVCLSCLGWEEQTLFYTHSARGEPSSLRLRKGGRITPQFPRGPLKPALIRLGEAGRRWHWRCWAGSNRRQNLNRVGGPGCWVQSADHPTCPGCDRAMALLIQLDSSLPMEDPNHEWLWGSGGMGYGHWCDRCRFSAWHWQCT
jgi:uncharacterized protein (TIGR02996 family)